LGLTGKRATPDQAHGESISTAGRLGLTGKRATQEADDADPGARHVDLDRWEVGPDREAGDRETGDRETGDAETASDAS
jgi:hypothetical protein